MPARAWRIFCAEVVRVSISEGGSVRAAASEVDVRSTRGIGLKCILTLIL